MEAHRASSRSVTPTPQLGIISGQPPDAIWRDPESPLETFNVQGRRHAANAEAFAVTYWLSRSPSDFRRQHKVGQRGSESKSSSTLLSSSRSLPELRSSATTAQAIVSEVKGPDPRVLDEIDNLQRMSDSARRQHSKLEAKRRKLAEQYALLQEELKLVEDDLAGKQHDLDTAGVTVSSLTEEIDVLTEALDYMVNHHPFKQFLYRRAEKQLKLAEIACVPLQRELDQLRIQEQQAVQSLLVAKQQLGRLDREHQDQLAAAERQTKDRELTIKVMRDELNERREERETIATVRRKAVDKLKAELGDGDHFDEQLMFDAERVGGEDSQYLGVSLLLTFEKLAPLEVPRVALPYPLEGVEGERSRGVGGREESGSRG